MVLLGIRSVLACAVAALLLVPGTADAEGCDELALKGRVSQKQMLACVGDEAAHADANRTGWIWAGAAAVVLGAATAWFLLRRTSSERAPRTEDEAWAELLGDGA